MQLGQPGWNVQSVLVTFYRTSQLLSMETACGSAHHCFLQCGLLKQKEGINERDVDRSIANWYIHSSMLHVYKLTIGIGITMNTYCLTLPFWAPCGLWIVVQRRIHPAPILLSLPLPNTANKEQQQKNRDKGEISYINNGITPDKLHFTVLNAGGSKGPLN